MKLPGVNWGISTYKRISISDNYDKVYRNFHFGDLRSGQFCGLPIITQWEKNHIPALHIRPGYFITNWVMLGYNWLPTCKFWSVTFIEVIWGHVTSSEATSRFGLITHDWKEIETWAWSHCACLITTHRLIYNMTYLGQNVISRDLDLRSTVDLTIQSHHAYASTRLDERSAMVPETCR